MHAVDVLGTRLDAHEKDLRPIRGHRLRLVGAEGDGARGGARRGRQAAGDHLALRLGIEGRMQELVERSEEHTSELQSLMRIPYAVVCLQKKTPNTLRN